MLPSPETPDILIKGYIKTSIQDNTKERYVVGKNAKNPSKIPMPNPHHIERLTNFSSLYAEIKPTTEKANNKGKIKNALIRKTIPNKDSLSNLFCPDHKNIKLTILIINNNANTNRAFLATTICFF